MLITATIATTAFVLLTPELRSPFIGKNFGTPAVKEGHDLCTLSWSESDFARQGPVDSRLGLDPGPPSIDHTVALSGGSR